ncbi:hypothetical protein Bca52824_027877 [Brassica carinata]|uniref:Uncharacterized protein n=1 Tax=Brassica carinata TaxID=52824 RepID=A0A8X7VB95_BRACI|nr:hypothetical protein Bca52824_027877 [Brassica carinata]
MVFHENYTQLLNVLPVDAQIIGTLNDMEIIGTSNIEDGEDDTAMMIVEQEDDLLGEEFMDIEAAAIMVTAAAD